MSPGERKEEEEEGERSMGKFSYAVLKLPDQKSVNKNISEIGSLVVLVKTCPELDFSDIILSDYSRHRN